jgi:hypothetical protein
MPEEPVEPGAEVEAPPPEDEDEPALDEATLHDEIRRGAAQAQAHVDVGGVHVQVDHIGTFVAGTNVSSASGRTPARPTASASTRPVAYVAPPCIEAAVRILTSQHVVVLHGPPRWGKRSMALELLHTTCASGVFEIDPSITLEELTRHQYVDASGYLVDTLPPRTAGDLTRFNVRVLAETVGRCKSFLVITIDNRVPLDDVDAFVVRCEDQADPRAVFASHLRHGASPDEYTTACALAKSLDIEARLPTLAGRPHALATSATLVRAAARGEIEEDVVLSTFDDHVRNEVVKWFADNVELDDRAFMISASVLDGAKYTAVSDAAHDLMDFAVGEAADPLERMRRTRSSRLVTGPYDVVPGFEETHLGLCPVEILTLADPRFADGVLQYAWQEQDGLRQPLLAWLCDLGFHASPAVRARAAAAVGKLLLHDFLQVRNAVLEPWSGSGKRRARLAAATALGAPAWNGETAPLALALLASWAGGESNWRRRWTAAAAYGGSVGHRFPEAAFRSLRRIGRGEDGHRLTSVLGAAAASLFDLAAHDPPTADVLLRQLVSWVSKSEPLDDVSLRVLEQLASSEVVDADGATWPTLLWLSTNERAEVVTKVFRKAVAVYGGDPVMGLLRSWVVGASPDTPQAERLGVLFGGLAGGGVKDRDRVQHHLKAWDKGEKPGAASQLLKSLG